jgi:recombination protein RecT
VTAELAVIEEDALGQALVGRRIDFVRMLGGEQEAERFIQEAYSAVNANPFLRQCTPASLFGALYFAAQIGLPVGGPLQQFHLTPRSVWNPETRQKEWQVVAVVGYNGLITLAMNTGEYDAIEGKLVYSNDEFVPPYEDESGTHFRLTPASGDRGDLLGVIGRALVKGSNRALIEWLTIDEIRDRMRPQNWEKTPWKTDEPAMVKKTGIRRVSKYTAKSRESHRFALALQGDQAVASVNDIGELEFVHDTAATEDWKALIQATDDKADLAAVADRIRGIENGEQVRESEMTPELRSLVLAHAGTLTKDSRPPADQPAPDEQSALAYGRDEAAIAEAARREFEGGERP